MASKGNSSPPRYGPSSRPPRSPERLPPLNLPSASSPPDHYPASAMGPSWTNGMPPPYQYPPMPGPPRRASQVTSAIPEVHEGHALGNRPVQQRPLTDAQTPQRREYRKRRTAPSCDQCRERKVKCDAEEGQACSECTSRGVTCRTADNSKQRSSTSKQVNDLLQQVRELEKQTEDLTRELAMANDRMASLDVNSDVDAERMTMRFSRLSPRKRARATASAVSNEARENVRDYARGVFKLPAQVRQSAAPNTLSHGAHPLPPRQTVDRLLASYENSVHSYSPHLHWPTFKQECEKLYQVGSFQQSSQTWVAVFFGVLACGTLMDPFSVESASEQDGARYVDMCMHYMDWWHDDFTLDSVRAAVLTSMYFFETNRRSCGSMWLHNAVMMAQDMGLQWDRNDLPVMEAEMRRRVWWAVYNWDRIVAMEAGRPLAIDDTDSDVPEPIPVSDEAIQPNAIAPTRSGLSKPSALMPMITIVRLIGPMKKALESRTLSPSTIATFDERFRSVMGGLPSPFPIKSTAPLDPRFLTAACALDAMQLMFYRHNLSPACSRQERRDALDRCTDRALATATYIQRSMQEYSSPTPGVYSPASMADWGARLRTMAPAFFVGHLWRCTLMLCMRLEFEAALIVLRALSDIGELRKNSASCGRYLAFFLHELSVRLHHGATKEALELDEEMMVYVSGDLQGCRDEAWIWGDGNDLATFKHDPDADHARGTSSAPEVQFSNSLSEREAREWGGWEGLQVTISRLSREQRRAHITLPPLTQDRQGHQPHSQAFGQLPQHTTYHDGPRHIPPSQTSPPNTSLDVKQRGSLAPTSRLEPTPPNQPSASSGATRSESTPPGQPSTSSGSTPSDMAGSANASKRGPTSRMKITDIM